MKILNFFLTKLALPIIFLAQPLVSVARNVPEAQNPTIHSPQEQINQPLELAQFQDEESYQNFILYRSARVLADSGELERALQVAQSIDDEVPYKDDVLVYLAIKLAETGELERALELAQSIDKGYLDYALSSMAAHLIETGDFEQVVNITQLAKDNSQENIVLVNAVRILASQGKVDKSLELATFLGSKLPVAQAKVLSAIAVSLVWQEEVERSLEITQSIDDAFTAPKGEALINIAEYYVQQGKADLATPLINQALELVD